LIITKYRDFFDHHQIQRFTIYHQHQQGLYHNFLLLPACLDPSFLGFFSLSFGLEKKQPKYPSVHYAAWALEIKIKKEEKKLHIRFAFHAPYKF